MVEGRGMARLTPESIDELRVVGEAGAEHLDRDIAIEESVMCEVHDRHPALADHLEQPVAASEDALGLYHLAISPRGSIAPYASASHRA
jgi:hypothetical protein